MCTLNILIHILLISGSFAPGTSFVNAIHAPANGATEDQHQATEVHPISIHAPANGATACSLLICCFLYFNPRSGERSDGQDCLILDDIRPFQSTLRRTKRLYSRAREKRNMRFQSMLRRTERPSSFGKSRSFQLISIHAPANGATALVSYS